MEPEKKYNPNKSESIKQQFTRAASRWKHWWNGQPYTLDDVNTIKLPATSANAYLYGIEPSYFASRNKGGKWNLEAQTNYGGEYLDIKPVAKDLELPALLDLMAQKNPRGMMVDRAKYWHPAAVAQMIGHVFGKDGPEAKPTAKPAEPGAKPAAPAPN